MKNVIKVSQKKANEIIETREPMGTFYYEHNGRFIAIDNSTGESFVEEFKDEETCKAWLSDSSIVYHTELDYGKTLEELKESQEQEPPKHEVIITETLVKSVEVYAATEEEAREKVQDLYNNEEVVLDWDDLDSVDFKVSSKEYQY